MNKNGTKIGWMLAAAGAFLLVTTGKLDLLIVLIPAAAMLAYGFLWVGHKHGNVTTGLK